MNLLGMCNRCGDEIYEEDWREIACHSCSRCDFCGCACKTDAR